MIAALLEALTIAVVAGVGVTTLFSVVVLAGARSIEARRNGHAVRIALWYTTCAVALAAFAAVVVLGVHVMLEK